MNACPRCETASAVGDIRCAVCALALVAHERRDADVAQILRCQECGAALRYSAELQAARCGFCGSALKLETPVDPIEQAELAVPFVVGPERACAVLRAWLGRGGFFAPRDLQSAARLEAVLPLFWAGWLVDARAVVSWTADSNAGAGRSSWAPHAGQAPMNFERLLVSASRGLLHHETAVLAAHTNLAPAEPTPRGPASAMVEQFDAQRSAARRFVTGAIEATAAALLQRGTIPGTRFRHVRVAVLLEGLATRRVVFPAYVLAYRYDGKLFRAIVHGQDERCVFGAVPRSYWKLVLILLAVVVGVVVLFVGLALLVSANG